MLVFCPCPICVIKCMDTEVKKTFCHILPYWAGKVDTSLYNDRILRRSAKVNCAAIRIRRCHSTRAAR